MRGTLIVAAAALSLTLTGCAAEPEDQIRGGVEDVIAAANDGDSAGLRSEAEDLLGTISELGGTGKLSPARETQLRDLTLAVLQDAGLLEVEPTPSPSPSEEPSPTPSPSPSEEPSPSPSPSEEPSPSPSEEEDEDDDPVIEVPLSPSPASSETDAESAPSPKPKSSPSASPQPSSDPA